MTLPLIDKTDNAEIIRDEIAAILTVESSSQVALATSAGKPAPLDWELRVFTERANPWENLPAPDGTDTPVVNVWWDSSTFDEGSSNVMERQKSSGTFNVDCYAYAASADETGGHVAGDEAAALAAQRAVRLARNILMAAEYTYLGLRGLVWNRRVSTVSNFQPQQDNQNVNHIAASRLVFRVDFNEYSPQVPAEDLELLAAQVERSEDGEIVVLADYDYTSN